MPNIKDENAKSCKAYYKANKDQLDAANKQNAIDNRDRYRPVKAAYKKNHPLMAQRQRTKRHAALRAELLTAFGAYCVCCGEIQMCPLAI